jgi:hypothetical protein
MSQNQPQPSTPVDSASEIAIEFRAGPLSTPHASATQLLMYTHRQRTT